MRSIFLGMSKEEFWFPIGQLAAMPQHERDKLMARRPKTGDDAEDNITGDDGESIPQDHTVAVLPIPEPEPEPQPQAQSQRRRIKRREEIPFTQEERLAVEGEIIEANTCMREIEETKKAQDKIWNGQITQYESTMNEAIDVLKKGTFTIDIERIEEFNYDTRQRVYYDVTTGEEVDSVDMTEEDLQTKMNM